MNNFHFCSRCGGVTSLYFDDVSPDVVVEDSGNGPEIRVGRVTYKCCMGHQPKHDGRLNEDGTHNVYPNNFGGIAIHANDGITWMDAKEALSLLAWLKQKETELQRLSEQGEV